MLKGNYLDLILLAGIILIVHLPISGQDGHYWTQQYGNRSMLLSNSVIGGVQDLGAVYYNPGRLGLIDNPAFLLSADVYEWSNFTVDDAVGDQTTISKSKFGGVPSVVAGAFSLAFLKDHHFAYALIQRQQINADLDYKNEIYGDVIHTFPGEEYFGGYIRINQKVTEQWFSLAWSYPFSKKFSIGLTTNGVLLNQNKGNQIDLQALSSEKQVALYRYDRNFSFNQYGLLWKAGFASEFGRLLWGLTVTSPVVTLKCRGDYNYEMFFTGIAGQSDGDDQFTTNSQEDIVAKYRSPWAIGTGFSLPLKRATLHISGEWYSKIPYYTLFEASDHYSQSSGDTISFRLVDQLKSVTNLGIGADVELIKKLSFYVSFSTDFSAASSGIVGFSEQKPVATNTVFSADYFHFAGGFMLNLPGAEIILGATHTGGKQDFARPVDFPEEGDDDIFEMDETSVLKWTRWRLVFSFSVPFFQDYLDRLGSKKKN